MRLYIPTLVDTSLFYGFFNRSNYRGSRYVVLVHTYLHRKKSLEAHGVDYIFTNAITNKYLVTYLVIRLEGNGGRRILSA